MEITINAFYLIGIVIASWITGALLMYGIKSVDNVTEVTYINPDWKTKAATDVYKGMTAMDIAKFEDQEYKKRKRKNGKI